MSQGADVRAEAGKISAHFLRETGTGDGGERSTRN